MLTYLLLHGALTLAILALLRIMDHAPPRLRMWLALAGMAIWILPMPLFRPTLSPNKAPQPVITTIRVFDATTFSKPENWDTQYWLSSATNNQSLPFWLGISLLVTGLLKWGAGFKRHRAWRRALNGSAKPLSDTSQIRTWGINAPVQTFPGYGAMTFGLRNPQIWVGERHLNQPEFKALVTHEWQHIQRNDNAITASIHLFECFFWWNPLVLFLGRKSRFFMELSCDLRCLESLERLDYQRAIAKTLHGKALAHNPSLHFAVTAHGNRHTTVQRLKLLERSFQMKPKQKWSLVILIALSGVAMAFPKTGPSPVLASTIGLQGTDSKDEIARVGQTAVEPPTFLEKPAPVYPERAKEIQLQGYVILEAIFRKDGSVTDIKILRGLGKGKYGFEEASANALRQWKFKPGRVDGVPADVKMTVKIDFVHGAQDLPAKVLAWETPDLPPDETGITGPYASYPNSQKFREKNDLTLAVDVEVSPDGDMLRFVPEPRVLDQLAFPEKAVAYIETLLDQMTLKPASFEGKNYRTLMRLEIGIPLIIQ